MDSWIFWRWLQNQNSLDWKVHFIIGKILEPKCLEWVRMIHLNTFNTSYGQKKGKESNCKFDSQPLEVRNRPNLVTCRWRAIYRFKTFDEDYNFYLDLISIKSLQKKLWASKVTRIPISRIFRLLTWESRDKMRFGCWPRGQAQRII
jgi:hypothetical protein